ncbi:MULTISPECIES: hypothetical protein [Roseobacteraceae]|uniref:hypothetical protein n=1 Tax=Roseobacteraceae TaxID=2854170 RepID=UPI0018F1DBB0|nr:hypothetical protein [Thalassococcus profundi]
MEQKPGAPKSPRETREDRLKAALKANLARRKAQARAKKAGAAGRDAARDETR